MGERIIYWLPPTGPTLGNESIAWVDVQERNQTWVFYLPSQND